MLTATPPPARRTLNVSLALALAALLGPAAFAQTCPSPGTEWASATSGNWGDAGNWTNGVPTSGLNACIIASGTYTVTLNVIGNARSLALGRTTGTGTQTLLNTSQSLNLSAASAINARGVYDWRGGTTGGGSTLTNGGLLAISGAAVKDIAGATTIRNQTLTTFDGTGLLRFLGSGSRFENAAGATFDARSDAGFTIFNGGNTFDNDGLFQKTGGTGASLVSRSGLAFDNGGTVDARVGTIQFDGSSTHDGGVFTASAGADVFFNAGTHTVVGTLSGSPEGAVRLDAGATLVDDGSGATLDFGGSGFEWQSGNVGGDLTNAGLLKLTTGGVKDLNGASTLTNQSRVEISGTGLLRFVGAGSEFVNATGATFDFLSDADFTVFNGGNTFTNNGLLVKSAVDPVNDAANTSLISRSGLDFDNGGTVDARAGTIQMDGGGTHADGVFTASAGADVFFNAGTHTIDGTISGSPGGVVRLDAGATLAGGTLDFGGSGFEWQSGNVGTLTNAGLLKLTTGGVKDLNGGATLTNEGRAEMSDTGLLRFLGTGSVFANMSSGTFDLLSDADFTVFNGGNTFDNDGLFQKTGGTGASLVSRGGLAFDNGGTVDAQVGTIQMDGGGTHDGGVFTASTDASVFFNAGIQTGTLTGSPEGVVRLDAGATLADATLDFGGSGFEWQGGNFGTVTNAGLLRLTTGSLKQINTNATLTNESLIEMGDTGALRFLGTGSVLVNASGGTFDLLSDAGFIIFNGGNSVSNSGLFQKTGGTGSSQISRSGLDFTNNAGGVVSAESGTIDVNGPFVHAGDALIQGTATIDFVGAALTQTGDTGPGVNPSPGLLAWTGAWSPQDASTLSIEIAGTGGAGAADGHDQLAVTGAAALDGELSVDLAGAPLNDGDTFVVLTASGGVSGTFDTPSPFYAGDGLIVSILYNANDVTLQVEQLEADYALAKTVDEDEPDVNDLVTFVVTITNNGPDGDGDLPDGVDAEIVVSDPEPDGLDFDCADCSVTLSAGTYDGGTGDWTLDNLGSGDSETLTIVARVTRAGTSTNTATLTDSEIPDTDDSNDEASRSVDGQAADLMVEKDAPDDDAVTGQPFTYVVTLTNNGPNDASDIVVSDEPPAGLTCTAVESTGDYDEATDEWSVPSLADDDSETLTFTCTAASDGVFTNTATRQASSPVDLNADNDTGRATVTVGAPATLACTSTAPLSFDADGDGTPTTVMADDFSSTAGGTFGGAAVGEFAGVRNEGTVAVDLSACSFVTFDPFDETVIVSAVPGGVVGAGDVFVLSTQNGDQTLPAGSFFDNPGAFALVTGAVAAGDPVASVFSRVVAAVVYDRDRDVFGSVGGGATPAEARAFRQTFLDVFGQATPTEAGGAVDLTVAAWPNPTRGAATVAFGLAEGGAARVAVYDALGREVAVLADRAFGLGRHEVLVGTLSTGVYIVRVATAGGVQTARLTVAR